MRHHSDGLGRLALGVAAGFAGTLTIQALLKATYRWAPEAVPPLRDEPGHFMVQQAERLVSRNVRRRIPVSVEHGAEQMLGLGYGLTFGVLYAALRPRGGSPLADGLVLGLACWAAGYLGWLPATGLMPPVWRQKAPQALAPAVDHVAYGLTTVAAYDWLRRLQHAF